MSLSAAIITLIFIIDPLGNIPVFVSILRHVPKKKRHWIVLRESFIALIILLIFVFFGHYFLDLLSLSGSALTIAGGLILFLIALKMIFPDGDARQVSQVAEPFIVPLAIPMIAGPSSIAWVMLISSRQPSAMFETYVVLAAWFVATIILYVGFSLSKFLGDRLLTAMERLMGMLLTVMAVQMLIDGVTLLL